jgi:hypothetical protein
VKTTKLSPREPELRQLVELATQQGCDPKVELDHWNRELDTLYAKMQSDEARHAIDALFSASDDELNRSRS